MKIQKYYRSVMGANSSKVLKMFLIALPLGCLVVSSCNTKKCEFPVYFQVSFVEPGTVLKIDIDSGSLNKQWKFNDGLHMTYEKRFEFLRAYCSSEDSILVKCSLNDQDTAFYLNRREVKGCFIGEDIDGKISLNY